MMKGKMLENVRGLLVLQMETLQGAACRTVIRMKDESGNLADFFDQATAEHDRSVELTIRDRERRQIREIRETLLRIDRGQFGNCERCGRAIASKRLLRAPMSRLCTACKQKLEEKSSHAGYPPVNTGVDHYAY